MSVVKLQKPRLALSTRHSALLLAGLLLVCLALPFVASAYVISLLFLLLMWVVMASSWNLLSGYTGYVSFGHAGFFGVGAYTAAILIWRAQWEWWLACLAGGVLCAALGVLIGGPALRLRGPYFAIALLGLSEVGRIVAVVWEPLTRGGLGISLPPDAELLPDYYAMLALALAAVGLVYGIANSKIGLRLLAIREDETAAEVVGVPTTRYKLLAFTLSAIFPGVAGGLYAWHVSYIDPGAVFAVSLSVRTIASAMFGGAGTVFGPVIGALLLNVLAEVLWVRFPFFHPVLFGGLIIVILLVMPGGIMALLQQRGILPRSRRL
ncbi:MAG TPA: branched-chain amino acid ABC transporter permease [Chloroflexota bacterium]|nr:branched-chain amino acid ABC transporter permease [Chloroflexota bacterium]